MWTQSKNIYALFQSLFLSDRFESVFDINEWQFPHYIDRYIDHRKLIGETLVFVLKAFLLRKDFNQLHFKKDSIDPSITNQIHLKYWIEFSYDTWNEALNQRPLNQIISIEAKQKTRFTWKVIHQIK